MKKSNCVGLFVCYFLFYTCTYPFVASGMNNLSNFLFYEMHVFDRFSTKTTNIYSSVLSILFFSRFTITEVGLFFFNETGAASGVFKILLFLVHIFFTHSRQFLCSVL